MEMEKMNYKIDDEHWYLEKMKECKASLKAQLEKHQEVLSRIDFQDGWSVARARFNARADNMDRFFQKYLLVAHEIECLKRAKRIAEAHDSIELIEFGGGYSGGPNVNVWCDHDSQRVAVVK